MNTQVPLIPIAPIATFGRIDASGRGSRRLYWSFADSTGSPVDALGVRSEEGVALRATS